MTHPLLVASGIVQRSTVDLHRCTLELMRGHHRMRDMSPEVPFNMKRFLQEGVVAIEQVLRAA